MKSEPADWNGHRSKNTGDCCHQSCYGYFIGFTAGYRTALCLIHVNTSPSKVCQLC